MDFNEEKDLEKEATPFELEEEADLSSLQTTSPLAVEKVEKEGFDWKQEIDFGESGFAKDADEDIFIESHPLQYDIFDTPEKRKKWTEFRFRLRRLPIENPVEEEKKVVDAHVFSKLLNVTPAFAYEFHDLLKKDMERKGIDLKKALRRKQIIDKEKNYFPFKNIGSDVLDVAGKYLSSREAEAGERKKEGIEEKYSEEDIHKGIYKPLEDTRLPAIPAYHREVNERALAAIRSGWQQSILGLIERQELPEPFEPENIAERILQQMAIMGGDFPAFLIGALVGGASGGPAAPITAPAGAVGFTAGLRKVLMDKYSKGEAKSFNEFWDRLTGAVKETVKGEIVGGATGAAGKFVPKPFKTPSEIGTLTTIGAALEGRVPEPEEFIDAAILLGGLKGASKIAGKLNEIYIKKGQRPLSVINDIFEKLSDKELEIILDNEKLLVKFLNESNVKGEPKKAITNLQKELIRLQKIAKKKQPILNKMGNAVADKLGLEYTGNVKKVSSLMLKVLRKDSPDFTIFSPYDHTRGAIILKDFSQLADAIKELSSQGKFEGFAAIDKPINIFGYKGIFAATRLGEGINGEIQIHTKTSWALKEKTDKIYQRWRKYEKGGKFKIPEDKFAEYLKDIEESRQLWTEFWDNIPRESKNLINSTIRDLNKRQ